MILDQVLNAIAATDAIGPGDTVIAAVSGGCDSVALLHILLALRDKLAMRLVVASLDHGIRGAAGQRDLDFVAELARRWQLPFRAGHADVPALARAWRCGLEAAARRARYDFLAGAARQTGSQLVATGHHADDQAETLLMRIVRGSGSGGLAGMRSLAPLPYHADIKLCRPLLAFSRAQLLAYCARHKLNYRSDASNDDRRYSRNFLRHEIMPRLKQLNPDALGAFARLADTAALEDDFLQELMRTQVLPALDIDAQAWRIPERDFAAWHPALRRRLLREAYHQLAGGQASLSHAMTLEIMAWAEDAKVGVKRDLGAGLEIYADYTDLLIQRAGSQPVPSGYRLIPAAADIGITPDAPIADFGLRIAMTDTFPAGHSRWALPLRPGLTPRLRTRKPGDRFKPRGMGGRSRKLKSWMIDRKLPRYLRDRIPLVAADEQILAICLGDAWHLAHCPPPAETAAWLALDLA